MAFKQAERLPTDGRVEVSLPPAHPGLIRVSVDDADDTGGSFLISEYNASRVLCGLALLLGIRINAQDAKGIKL